MSDLAVRGINVNFYSGFQKKKKKSDPMGREFWVKAGIYPV